MNKKHKIVVPALLGPTAVGKTALAIDIAVKNGCEIVSCDSRQIYRYLDIGTAKPTPLQQTLARHWMIDLLEPSQQFSAHDYAVQARTIIRARHRAGAAVMVCGGTGLYFKSLSEGLYVNVASNPAFRQQCEQEAAANGPDSLYRQLELVDPHSARRLHPHDIQRVIRALQVFHDSGIPLSEHSRKVKSPSDMAFAPIILMLPREQLYARIDYRVRRMFDDGLWDEFHGLRRRGFDRQCPAMACVGYAELFDVEEGKMTIAEAMEKIARHTRRFAKRQFTWFRHQCARGLFVDMSTSNAAEQVCRHIAVQCGK